jgi:hypothetical protein
LQEAQKYFPIAASFSFPLTRLKKMGGNYKKLLLKYPFEMGDLGGFKNFQTAGIYGKR